MVDFSNTKSQSLFNLQENIDIWIDKIKVEPSITEADIEELHSHLLDLIDDLKGRGLNDKEAFLVASKRLRVSDDLADEYRQENNNVIQMRRSLIILVGVLIFFLVYYFIKAFSKAVFVSIYSFSESNGILAIEWYNRILISWYFIFLFFFVGVYFFEKKVTVFLEKVKLKPKHTILIFGLTVALGLADFYFRPLIKKLFEGEFFVIDRYIHSTGYFELSFPIVICIGFIFIYYKYYKKAKI